MAVIPRSTRLWRTGSATLPHFHHHLMGVRSFDGRALVNFGSPRKRLASLINLKLLTGKSKLMNYVKNLIATEFSNENEETEEALAFVA